MTDHQKTGGWNLQDWKMTDEVAGVEFVRHVIVSSTNLKTYIIPHLELYLLEI